jgi:DNA-binding MarR family transcriptional regulator
MPTTAPRSPRRTRKTAAVPARASVRHAVPPVVATLEAYAPRGMRECGYANLKLLSRVFTSLYDEALRPAQLRASQLALLWAIVALEPVELGQLGSATLTDQTTLSRTVENLRRAKLVTVVAGDDRRKRIVALTPLGRRRFAAAMPYWEDAQRRAAELLPLAELRKLARQVRRASAPPAGSPDA